MRGVHGRVAAACALATLALVASPVAAQRLSLGLEAGGVSVDGRRGPQPAIGISLLWPMGDVFAGALSYAQWFPGGPDPAASTAGTIGERGLTLSGLLRAAQTERLLWLIGGGFGQYERIVTTADATDHTYDAALTATTVFMLRVTDRIATYLKADLSTPTGEWDARWGNLLVGLALPLF